MLELREKVIALEAFFLAHVSGDKEALVLAREILDKDLTLARVQMEHRLEQHNEWQKRWDKREMILASKDDLDKAIKTLECGPLENLKRLIYVGLGMCLLAGAMIGSIIKFWTKG